MSRFLKRALVALALLAPPAAYAATTLGDAPRACCTDGRCCTECDRCATGTCPMR